MHKLPEEHCHYRKINWESPLIAFGTGVFVSFFLTATVLSILEAGLLVTVGILSIRRR